MSPHWLRRSRRPERRRENDDSTPPARRRVMPGDFPEGEATMATKEPFSFWCWLIDKIFDPNAWMWW